MPQQIEPELVMSFDPSTIEDLGVRMYSTLPPVLAELIANSYDADAEHVFLRLNDSTDKKEIVIEDDGFGMSFEEINEKFLRIGRKRRTEDPEDQKTPKGRKIIGKKGLGKLSFFGIAREIEITTKKDGKENSFTLKWEEIKNSRENEYKPDLNKFDENCKKSEHGTTIILRDIQRKTDFHPETLAISLSKMFILDTDFKVSIQHNSGKPVIVSNEKRYDSLEKQIEWKLPNDVSQYTIFDSYENANKITGLLIATEKPISPKTNMRGITLFSRKKLVNAPEYFSDSTSSNFFSYLTGYLEVDFIDEIKEDVISTNRQSLNWDDEEMQDLRKYLQGVIKDLERDWRSRRRVINEEKAKEKTGIDIPSWLKAVPEPIKTATWVLIDKIIGKPEFSENETSDAIEKLHKIVPKYPYYHWRNLHQDVQSTTAEYYKNANYYTAALEATKKYIIAVRSKANSSETDTDTSVMGRVFGQEIDHTLKIAQGFTRSNNEQFSAQTINSIEDGQKHLSMGLVQGFRNPASHEEFAELEQSGLFAEQDCLDILSLLSHLFKRLDNARTPEKQ